MLYYRDCQFTSGGGKKCLELLLWDFFWPLYSHLLISGRQKQRESTFILMGLLNVETPKDR